MSLRYIGGLVSPSVNPLAANVTTSPNVAQYNGVFTLQQQAQALTSNQWATDPYYKNTTLLLHADGKASGSQNNTFLDSSTNNFTITRNGNTTQGSFTPYGPTWSNYFNGSSDYLTVASNAAFQMSTGDFTIECWVFVSNISNQMIFIDLRGASSTTVAPLLYMTSSGVVNYYTGGSVQITGSAITANTWTHLAVSRSGTSTKLFINGIQAGSTYSDSNNYVQSSVYIARASDAAGSYVNGYISNARIVKGTAVYTSAFTPSTTPLIAVSGTSLLTCQSNRFIDNSTANSGSGFAITVAGTPSVQRFSPFAPQYQYTPAVIGGSGYFDGTGDSLVTPSITVGTNPFCFECWVYPPVAQSNSNGPGLFSATTTNGLQCAYYSNTGLGIAQKGVAWQVYENTIVPTVGQWNHVAFVRSGTGTNQTSVFLNGVRVANGTVSYSYAAAAYSVSILDGDFTPFLGYIADCRFTNGSTPYDATQSTITIPTAPLTTSASNTVLLLSMTNAGIYDNAMMNNLETVSNAQVSTSVVKYGSGSMYFDGTSYLKSSPYFATGVSGSFDPIWNFGTGDFTVEAWIYYSTTTRNGSIISNGGYGFSTADSNGWSLQVYGSGAHLGFNTATTQNNFINNNAALVNSTLPNNQWNHIAVTRSGTNLRCFVNGTQVGSTITNSTNCDGGSTYVPKVAADQNGQSTYMFTGYIDDLRITKGVARYTSNFIPPKVAFANQ